MLALEAERYALAHYQRIAVAAGNNEVQTASGGRLSRSGP